jgi:hypothetical protein
VLGVPVSLMSASGLGTEGLDMGEEDVGGIGGDVAPDTALMAGLIGTGLRNWKMPTKLDQSVIWFDISATLS